MMIETNKSYKKQKKELDRHIRFWLTAYVMFSLSLLGLVIAQIELSGGLC